MPFPTFHYQYTIIPAGIVNTQIRLNLIVSLFFSMLVCMSEDVIENKLVICRDRSGVALERVVISEGRSVFYVTFPEADTRFSAELWPIGFPKGDVFAWRGGVDGQEMSDAEWSTLKPYEGR
jgi:hypothetical protein